MNELVVSQIVSIIAIGFVILLLLKNKKLKDDLWDSGYKMIDINEDRIATQKRLDASIRLLSESERILSKTKGTLIEYVSIVEKYETLNKNLLETLDETIKIAKSK
jgi:hypothetical protein